MYYSPESMRNAAVPVRVQTKQNPWLLCWLVCGMVMVVVQVLLGGITRVTESGLSITEWKPVLGALPPLSQEQWLAEFDKYRQIDQYKVRFSAALTLADFKYLYFWEWLHRNWARLTGLVFLGPFAIFYFTKKITRQQVQRCLILFGLGVLQAFAGWVMVASGLKEGNVFVEPLFLAVHFFLAMLTLAVILHFVLDLRFPADRIVVDLKRHRVNTVLFGMVCIQLLFGVFLAGVHGVSAAPTWPTINGSMIPDGMFTLCPPVMNFVYNPITLHFVHRTLAYCIFFSVIGVAVYHFRHLSGKFPAFVFWVLPILCMCQVCIGILVLLFSVDYRYMSVFAVVHQFIGVLIFLYMVFLHYAIRK